MFKLSTTLLSVLLLGACATHSKVIATRPVIRSVAVIPASNPVWYSFENAAPPVGGYPFQFWVNKLDSHGKARRFNDLLKPQQDALGTDYTDTVVSALREAGLTVEVLDLPRLADDPDNVVYEKIATRCDAILHLRISEVGMYSAGFSRRYLPRVNASAKLWPRDQDDNLYDADLYYGVDAKAGREWAVVADPKYSYATFEDVMAHADDVHAAFAAGVAGIGKRAAAQMIALPATTRRN